MIRAGYSPSVRLFEAAACGTPIISDYWKGLESFFELSTEVLVARSSEDVMHHLKKTDDEQRLSIRERARERVLKSHTAAHRAAELESFALDVLNGRGR